MFEDIILEIYPFEQPDSGAPKSSERNTKLYKSSDGVFVPHEDKKTPLDDEYEYWDIAEDDELPEADFEPRAPSACRTKNLGTLYHVPQVKFRGLKCYKRYKKYALIIRYCYPTGFEQKIKDAIEDCVGIGFLAALPFIPNIPAMISAFSSAFKACMIRKGLDQLEGFSFRIYRDSYYTKWKRC